MSALGIFPRETSVDFKVSWTRYQLIPRTRLNALSQSAPRSGALLKFQFNPRHFGYADCFPWPELGDLPLEDQLRMLGEGELTPLTQRSLALAQIDAQARISGVDLWDGAQIPPSHFLVTDLNDLTAERLTDLQSQGFDRVKIKVGHCPEMEAAKIFDLSDVFTSLDLKIRLDFNSALTQPEINSFLKNLGPARETIDFIEDPIPFHPEVWTQIQTQWNIRLALDRMPSDLLSALRLDPTGRDFKQNKAFSVVVLKPAVQDPGQIVELAQALNIPIIITSYLDHPLGQLGAAWCASELVRQGKVRVETCGLLSQHAYQPHPWSSVLQTQGPRLLPPKGGLWAIESDKDHEAKKRKLKLYGWGP